MIHRKTVSLLCVAALFACSEPQTAEVEQPGASAGENVEDIASGQDIAVEAQNPALQNSPMIDEMPDEEGFTVNTRKEICYWNDKKYSDGATVCENGRSHKCWNGRWVGGNFCRS